MTHLRDWWKDDYWWPPTMPDPPLINVYRDDCVFLWFVLVEEGLGLSLEMYEDDQEGEPPTWFEEEMSTTGVDIFTDTGHYMDSLGQMATWAMEQGIAPFQPFRIALDRPHYFRSGGYEYPEEWDVEYDWEVDKVIPISDFEAARRWEHYFMDRRRGQEELAQRRKWVNNILKHDPEFLYLDWYTWGGPYDSWHTRGKYCYRVTLRAAAWIEGHYETKDWAQGENRDGDREAALKEMLKKAKEAIPHLHGNKIRNLPTAPRYPRYSWKRAA